MQRFTWSIGTIFFDWVADLRWVSAEMCQDTADYWQKLKIKWKIALEMSLADHVIMSLEAKALLAFPRMKTAPSIEVYDKINLFNKSLPDPLKHTKWALCSFRLGYFHPTLFRRNLE